MRTILIRLAEMLVLSAAFSSSANIIFPYLITEEYEEKYFALFLFLLFVAFVVINVIALRRCYCEIHNEKIYYQLNIGAYLIFILISLAAYWLLDGSTYAFIFNILKFLRFTGFGFSALGATLVSHVLMIVVVLLAPTGLGWIFNYD